MTTPPCHVRYAQDLRPGFVVLPGHGIKPLEWRTVATVKITHTATESTAMVTFTDGTFEYTHPTNEVWNVTDASAPFADEDGEW